jgi:hypothetical protein
MAARSDRHAGRRMPMNIAWNDVENKLNCQSRLIDWSVEARAHDQAGATAITMGVACAVLAAPDTGPKGGCRALGPGRGRLAIEDLGREPPFRRSELPPDLGTIRSQSRSDTHGSCRDLRLEA